MQSRSFYRLSLFREFSSLTPGWCQSPDPLDITEQAFYFLERAREMKTQLIESLQDHQKALQAVQLEMHREENGMARAELITTWNRISDHMARLRARLNQLEGGI